MGKFGNHEVKDIWEYATRTLSAFDAATLGVPADVWAAAARTLTDISAEEIFDLPEIDSIYPAVALQSSATANTFGSWVELSADVGVGKRLIAVIARQHGESPTYYYGEFEIGEGAEGSEVAITRFNQSDQWFGTFGGVQSCCIPLWRALTDNARLSVRVKDATAATGTYIVGVQVA